MAKMTCQPESEPGILPNEYVKSIYRFSSLAKELFVNFQLKLMVMSLKVTSYAEKPLPEGQNALFCGF